MSIRPIKNLIGKRFGNLLVKECLGSFTKTNGKQSRIFWLCNCDCGGEKRVSGGDLVNDKTKSCGCLRTATAISMGKKNTIHGMTKSTEYKIWMGMKRRCHAKGSNGYPFYGAKGIRVCKEWRDSFSAFYKHVGPRPSNKHTLDRIDNSGNYRPGNVRWATWVQQARNRSNNLPKSAHWIIDMMVKHQKISWRAAYKRLETATLAFNIHREIINNNKRNKIV